MIATETEILHFNSIYSHKNLTKAAQALNTTQPALTQSLLRLEHKLGVSLFIRTKQGCTPTAEGEIFYDKAGQLQEYWKEISQSLLKSHQGLEGKFRLGVHPSMAAYLLPELFKRLNQKAPLIEMKLTHDLSRNLTEKVIRLELDVALVVNPEKHPDLVIKKLGTDRLGFWRNSKAKDVPKILFSDTSAQDLKKIFKTKGKFLNEFKVIETSSLELIRTLVKEGAGYGFLPERVADLEESIRPMNELPYLADEICLIYRVGAMKSKSAKMILESISLN